MKTWILASATALVAVAGLAQAAEPWSSPPGRGSPARTPVFPTAHAWVNSMRQEAAVPAPAAPALRPAIVGSGNIGQSGNERPTVGNAFEHGATIAATAWNGEHQYAGYVYSPGACDYTPPCVDHLWDGYCQNPCRCRTHCHHFHRGCGLNMGCSTCNTGCQSSCSFGGCHGCRLHGLKHFGGSSCGCQTGCNTCNTGCGHGFGGLFAKHRGWFGNLCNACDGGMSCGCAASINGDAPPSNAEPITNPAGDKAPVPTADDDAKSARRNTINRYLPWSMK